MATTTDTSGVIFVANLTTPAQWVDFFIVEVYPANVVVGTPGTRITAGTSKVRWVQQPSGAAYSFLNVQQDLITLKGLTTGEAYNLRAGVAAPVSGIITWLATEANVIAGVGIGSGTIGGGTTGTGTGTSGFGCCDCIDVRAYGAVGDGVTDDTVAVQSALNAAAANAGNGVATGTTQLIVDIGTIVCVNSGLNCMVKATHLDASTGSGLGACYVALFIDSGVTLRVNGTITLGGGTATTHPWVIVENRNAFISSDTRIMLDGIGTYNVNTTSTATGGARLVRHTNFTGEVYPDNSSQAAVIAGGTTNGALAWDSSNNVYVWGTNGIVQKFDANGNLLSTLGPFLDSHGSAIFPGNGAARIIHGPTEYLVGVSGSVWGSTVTVINLSTNAMVLGPIQTVWAGLQSGGNSGAWDVDSNGVWLLNVAFGGALAGQAVLTYIPVVGGGSLTTYNLSTLHGWSSSVLGCLCDPVTGDLIIGTGSSGPCRVRKSDMSIVAHDTSGESIGVNMGADGCYCYTEGSLTSFVKVRASDFARVFTWTIYDYGSSASMKGGPIYDSAKNIVYCQQQGGNLSGFNLNNKSPNGFIAFNDPVVSPTDAILWNWQNSFGVSVDGSRILTEQLVSPTGGFLDFWAPTGGGQNGCIAFRFNQCAYSRVRDITIENAYVGGYWGNSENSQILDTYLKYPAGDYGYILDRCVDGVVRNNYLDGTNGLEFTAIADYANRRMCFQGNVCYAVDYRSLYHTNTGFEDTSAVATPYYCDNLFKENVCGDGSGCVIAGASDYGIRFEGNVIENAKGIGLTIGGLTDCSFSGNTIEKCNTGLAANTNALVNISILNNNIKNNTVDIVMPWTAGQTSVLNGNANSTVVMWNPAIDSQIYTSFATRSSISENTTGTKAGKAFPLSGPANMRYSIRGGVSPLSQSGSSKNIVIAPFTMDFPDKPISYAGTTLAVSVDHGWTTYKVYVDDTWHDGTTDVSYGTTIYDWELSSSQGRIYIGDITLSASGGGAGIVPGSAAAAGPFIVGCTFDGTIPNSEILVNVPIPIPIQFPAGMTGSLGTAGVTGTGSAVFTLNKNGVQFGTMTFAAGQSIPTFAASTATSFAVGDIFTVLGPSSADATLADIGFVIVAQKTIPLALVASTGAIVYQSMQSINKAAVTNYETR